MRRKRPWRSTMKSYWAESPQGLVTLRPFSAAAAMKRSSTHSPRRFGCLICIASSFIGSPLRSWLKTKRRPGWAALYFAYISIVAFSVGRLCHVSEVYICRRMRGVAGIRVARGLDKNFPQIGESRRQYARNCVLITRYGKKIAQVLPVPEE
jgi:hypothetical protein